MKERAILFSAPMVRAILAGTKTQTRRLVKPQPYPNHVLSPAWGTSPDGFEFGAKHLWRENGPDYPDGPEDERRCPYGVPGDRLWVREPWGYTLNRKSEEAIAYSADNTARVVLREYGGEGDSCGIGATTDAPMPERWRPSIHMPRWASRITLEVTNVRVERLQAITEADARAEGVATGPQPGKINGKPGTIYTFTHRDAFTLLWNAINGKRASWASNPWVWIVGVRRV